MMQSSSIRLRAVEPEDLDFMYLIENDTQLWKYGASNVPFSRFALRNFIEQTTNNLSRDGQLRLTIEHSSGFPIGFIDLENYDAVHNRAEVGIVVSPEWQNQGVAGDALSLLMQYASDILHVHLLYAYVCRDNKPALRLFGNAGFMDSGVLPQWIRLASAYSDVIVFTKVLAD